MRFLLTAEDFGAAGALRTGLMPGIMRSQDAAEGLRSFTERREARSTGH